MAFELWIGNRKQLLLFAAERYRIEVYRLRHPQKRAISERKLEDAATQELAALESPRSGGLTTTFGLSLKKRGALY